MPTTALARAGPLTQAIKTKRTPRVECSPARSNAAGQASLIRTPLNRDSPFPTSTLPHRLAPSEFRPRPPLWHLSCPHHPDSRPAGTVSIAGPDSRGPTQNRHRSDTSAFSSRSFDRLQGPAQPMRLFQPQTIEAPAGPGVGCITPHCKPLLVETQLFNQRVTPVG